MTNSDTGNPSISGPKGQQAVTARDNPDPKGQQAVTNWTETLSRDEADELARLIDAAILAQPPEWQEAMSEAIRSGAKVVGYIWSEAGDVVTVTFDGVPLREVRRSDLSAPRHPAVN